MTVNQGAKWPASVQSWTTNLVFCKTLSIIHQHIQYTTCTCSLFQFLYTISSIISHMSRHIIFNVIILFSVLIAITACSLVCIIVNQLWKLFSTYGTWQQFVQYMLSMCDNSAALVSISLIAFIDICIFHENYRVIITVVNIFSFVSKIPRILVAIMY